MTYDVFGGTLTLFNNNVGKAQLSELMLLQGPEGETIGALTQPMPYSYLIFRAPSDAAGQSSVTADFHSVLISSTLLVK